MESYSRRTALRAALTAAGLGVAAGAGVVTATSATAAHRTSERLTDLERDEPERLLAVVSKTQPIDPLDYEPGDLVTFRDSDYQVRAEVADHLELMLDAAQDDGVSLVLISGYRSHQTQAEVYDYWVQRNGRRAADRISARPGHSEHQTGLAIDVDGGTGECYLDQCFGDTEAGRWLTAHAHDYGFIESYPDGAEHRTGFTYEPWHWRYVGPRAAGRMHRLDIALLEDYANPERAVAEIGLWLSRQSLDG